MKDDYWYTYFEEANNRFIDFPDLPVLKYYEVLKKSKCILDLGAGDGRNIKPFLHFNNRIIFAENNERSIEKFQDYISLHGDRVSSIIDFKKSSILEVLRSVNDDSNDFVICSNVIQFFRASERQIIFSSIKRILNRGGHLLIKTFNISDPTLVNAKPEYLLTEEQNTIFVEKDNLLIHYFQDNELMDEFSDFSIQYKSNSFELDLSHGKPHYHAIETLLLKRN